MLRLTSPLKVGRFVLKNRIVMPPMANNLADERGRVTPALIEHYGRHASGGAALIMVEHSYVTSAGRIDPHQLGIWEDDGIAGLAKLAEVIHEGGALAGIQITHGGSRCPSSAIGQQPVAPSDVPVPGDTEAPRPLSLEEVETLPALFAQAARRAAEAGFDGVEVHGAHGYLLNQFVSPLTNRRADAYGGSPDTRLRLVREVIQAVAAAVGRDVLLLYRFPADDGLPGGITPEHAGSLAPRLATWGVQLLDCTGGLGGSRPGNRQGQGFFVPAAATVRQALRDQGINIPVAGVGGITEPEWADRAIREEVVDLVCVGRAQLRDPEWPGKALETVTAQA